eukprot:COSAG04_NODE_8430_length_976_cov_6.778791_1_plen_186_part_01
MAPGRLTRRAWRTTIISVFVLVVDEAALAQEGGGGLLPAGDRLVPNPACDTVTVLYDKVQELDAACPGAPAQCTPGCGAALFPLLDICASFLDALYAFDAADGERDNRAGVFYQLRDTCAATPSSEVIAELRPLWADGRCPDDWMEDVSATAVGEAECRDVRPNCEVLSKVMSCETDMCPGTACAL